MSNINSVTLMYATKQMSQTGASWKQTVSLVLDWWEMDWGREYYIISRGDSIIGEPEIGNDTAPNYTQRTKEWMSFYEKLGRDIREGETNNLNFKTIEQIIEYVTTGEHESVSMLLGVTHKKAE